MPKPLNNQLRKLTLALALPLAAATLPGFDLFHPITDAEYVTKAKAAQAAGDLKASTIELKNALLKNPDNIEARQMLGEINAALGNGADAEKELRKAMELGVRQEYVLLPLAKALFLQKKHQQVIDEINVPNMLRPDERAMLMVYRGEAWLGLGKRDQAKAEFEQALATDGQSGPAKFGLARLAFTGNELDKALQLAKEAVDAAPGEGPGEAPIWSLLATLYKIKGNLEQAEVSYSKAIDILKTNQTDLANRALLRIEMKKLKEADEDIDVLKKIAPKFFLTHYASGLLDLAQQKYPEAQASLEESIRLDEHNVLAQYFLAVSQFYQQHWDQAEKSLSSFLTASPRSIQGLQMMAWLKFQKKDYKAAKNYIAPVATQLQEDVFSLKLLADIEFALGNNEQALAHLKKLTELDPKSAQTTAQLGLGLLGTGHTEEGLKHLQAATELDPNLVQSDVYAALAYIRDKRYDKAQRVIDKLKEKMPNSAVPLDLEGMAYARKGDKGNAKRSFESALKLAPKDLTASNSLAQLALQDKDFENAIAIYKQILQDHPKHVPALLALADLRAAKGKLQETEGYIKQAIEAAPEVLYPRILLARLYTRVGLASKALALLAEVSAEHSQNPDFLAALAEAQIGNHNAVEALDTAKNLARRSPKSPLAHYVLARAYAETGDSKNMRASLDASLKLDPKFFRSRLAMVRLLEQERKTDEAKKQLDALKTEFPENPEVLDLQGWFAMHEGKPEEALKNYNAVLDKSPPSSQMAVNLAQAQWTADQKDLAVATLGKWLEQYPQDVPVRFVLSSYYSSLGQADKAEAQLKAILESTPNDVLALNNLAWMIRKEKPAEAVEYAEKSMSLAPKSPMTLDTLAMILLETRQNERALSLMKQAYSIAPTNPEVRYHLALAYEKNSRVDDAKKALIDLLAESIQFEERQEAEQLLNRLK